MKMLASKFERWYMEPQILAAFYLNKINRQKFELIYSKYTFIEALRELKNDGSAV